MALLLSACAASRDKASNGAKPTNQASPQEGANQSGAEPIAVITAQATTREVPQTLLATGNITAFESSDVAPQINGQVVATPVDVGAFVKQGAVLARLDTRDAQARLQQATAAER
jgi:multidrug efflux pump subunit AcrA (membrane-fusion protein)